MLQSLISRLLTWPIIQSGIRHVLTGGGAILFSHGLADQADVNTAIGAAMALVGFGWSVFQKWESTQSASPKTSSPGNGVPLLLALILSGSGMTRLHAAPDNTAAPIVSAGSWADFTQVANDLYNDLLVPLETDTNDLIALRTAGGLNSVDHRPIVLAMATVPVSTLASVGFIGGYGNNSWMEGGATLTLGVTNSVPLIGIMQEFAGDGVVYDFRTQSPANYSFTGFEKYFPLSPRATAGFGAMIANTSDEPGIDVMVEGNFNWQF